MKKLFFATDALIFIKDEIDMDTLENIRPHLSRYLVFVYAHPGVREEDILNEVQEIEDGIERGDLDPLDKKILITTLTEHEDLVVSLTYDGFVKVSEGLSAQAPGTLRRERYAALTHDLVRIRDNGGKP